MFKKKQKIIKILDIRGLKTATIQEVESVKKGVVHLIDSDLTYDMAGDEIDPAPLPGVSSYLVCFDGGEEDKLK